MTRTRQAQGNESIEARIDALLRPAEAARAKASLRTADLIVDAGFALAPAMRSAAAFVARQFRSVFVSSPQQ